MLLPELADRVVVARLAPEQLDDRVALDMFDLRHMPDPNEAPEYDRAVDIVETAGGAEGLARSPLLVLDRVREFLDEHGLGSGAVHAHRIGEGGGSNFTFLLEREDGSRYVLRRPPRPPLPPSAHDVVREARLQLALAPLGIRVPNIRAV